MIITNIINKIKMINFLKIFLILILASSILGCTNNQFENNVCSPDKIVLKNMNFILLIFWIHGVTLVKMNFLY